jgi:hypothetical protein
LVLAGNFTVFLAQFSQFFGVFLMKLSKLLISLSLVAFSATTLAVTIVAPDARVRIWQGSSASLQDSQYYIGQNSSLGTIKILKYNPNTTTLLTTLNLGGNAGGLDMANKNLVSYPWNKGSYQRLSENGIPSGECVAFAKAMTGVGSTSTWYKGATLMSYLVANVNGYSVNPYVIPLQPGTMLAHFQGLTKYPQSVPYGHVTIFLSWSKNAQGMVDGINVVDQNLVTTIDSVTGANGTIQVHKIPLNGSSTATYNSSGYSVVDVH